MQQPCYTAAELALALGGILQGESTVHITGLNRIEYARAGELTFVQSAHYAKYLQYTQASCVLIPRDLPATPRAGQALIRVDHPYRAFVAAMALLVPEKQPPWGSRHPSAIVDPTATIAPTAVIGAYCVIGPHCVVADRVILHPMVVLYEDVSVGESSVLHAGVVCYPRTVIGKRCLIHAGVVLGADGFGFWEGKQGELQKIPHVGGVVLGDGVEIGANTTVDRSLAGNTEIGDGTKVDNLVHVAHNVSIGEHTAIAAQVGISGSTRLGKRNRLGGQVGIVGHVSIGDDVVIEAKSGVSKSLPGPGRYFGTPAREHYVALRQEAALRQLPELLREVQNLRRQVEELRTWYEASNQRNG
ncbi:MAG: UDP-3-O-(3-hydroxymyristoyl)glucosamine N-acyltransferase [Candidatus Kapabacteria bacterium]|nr:UDP-3-O-(3-hydroxymyristoyl)glucosamine N-acyltransferase [Candidatus Kapabacteria bacterium]MDW8225464.1 UDP-3-O-(3-hydroxymyristoyl)glucosamine N-acyltransferase [Bacteroidota bacterium]